MKYRTAIDLNPTDTAARQPHLDVIQTRIERRMSRGVLQSPRKTRFTIGGR